jgi:hypothetical protein
MDGASMITYKGYGVPIGKRPFELAVYSNGRRVGAIVNKGGGWQYFPKGSKEGGDIFPILRECKNSLEGE